MSHIFHFHYHFRTCKICIEKERVASRQLGMERLAIGERVFVDFNIGWLGANRQSINDTFGSNVWRCRYRLPIRPTYDIGQGWQAEYCCAWSPRSNLQTTHDTPGIHHIPNHCVGKSPEKKRKLNSGKKCARKSTDRIKMRFFLFDCYSSKNRLIIIFFFFYCESSKVIMSLSMFYGLCNVPSKVKSSNILSPQPNALQTDAQHR